MLKFFVLLFTMLLSLTAYTREPIIPWPLDTNRQDIDGNAIEGLWTANFLDTRLCIGIAISAIDSKSANIFILLNGVTQNILRARLGPINSGYAGKIESPENLPVNVSLFRSRQSLFLRIQTKGHYYQEFQLRRASHCGLR